MYTVKEFEDLVGNTLYKLVSKEISVTGGFVPSVYIIATINPLTKEVCTKTEVAILRDNTDFDSDLDKDRFKKLAQEVAVQSSAVALVFVSEAFFVKRDIKGMANIGQVSQQPDKREAIMFSLEHLSYGPTSKLWMSEITVVDGKKVMGPMDKSLAEGGVPQGRFVGILAHPTKEVTA